MQAPIVHRPMDLPVSVSTGIVRIQSKAMRLIHAPHCGALIKLFTQKPPVQHLFNWLRQAIDCGCSKTNGIHGTSWFLSH
uniref:Uncharacterized protein n=1 Tax=Anguilla anguilla TaxID=7936 RepID=A0A0E9WG56_ANGAN